MSQRDETGRAPARRRPGALLVLVTAELLLTAGAVALLFLVYSLWWSDVLADRSAGDAGARLRSGWAVTAPASPPGQSQAPPPTGAGSASPRPPTGPSLQRGDDVGFLHVPAMGDGYQVLIRMGADPEILADGVAGVYTEPYRSAMPWDTQGNFTLAAHRDGHGAKFHNLDAVKPGDALVVETRDDWYVYRVDGGLPETSKFDTGVIAPVPVGSPYSSPGRYITLTTCTPVYTSRYRMVVWGSLVRVEPVDARRTPPPELR